MSFSKALLGLAAVTVLSSLASAQAPTLSCTALPVDNPALRDNGVTERVGDVKIICSGGTSTANGAQVPKFNLQIFTSPGVNITSRLLGGDVSEALLLIDEPIAEAQLLCGSTSSPAGSAAGVCDIQGTGSGSGVYSGATGTAITARPNAFVGRQVGPTSIVWSGIPFDPPGTSGTRTLRLTNVRVNASQLNNVRGSATSVSLIISTTSSGVGNSIQVPIGNQAPTVGIAQTPMDFGASNASYLQCESQNFSGGAATPGSFPGDLRLALTFTEKFNSAFRRRSANRATGDFSAPPTNPGESNVLDSAQLFESESGFYKTPGTTWDLSQTGLVFSLSTANLGLASSGTRLLARFKNLPSGATLYYANHAALLQVSATTTPNPGAINATLADANGGGVYSSLGATGYSALTAVSGAGAAVWEVIETNTNVTERATVPLALAYGANTSNSLPTLGSATADGQMAPLSATAVASATAQIPRFVEDATNNGKSLFTINACRSNLLFPFVVNGAGYETGIAISNTTKDPFGTQSQTGGCTVTFYGKSGTSNVCLTQTSTKTITGGEFLSWTLGGGGDVAATPNFTGYAIAQCNFQYGHGFAFITDTLVQKIAQGYLALVLDDPLSNRGGRTGSKSEVLGQ